MSAHDNGYEKPTIYMASPRVVVAMRHFLKMGGSLPTFHRDSQVRGDGATTYVSFPKEEVASDEWALVSFYDGFG